jgi:hypothetical protein
VYIPLSNLFAPPFGGFNPLLQQPDILNPLAQATAFGQVNPFAQATAFGQVSPFAQASISGQVSPFAQVSINIGGVNLQCLAGVVTLFRFIQPPAPGSVIGTLRTTFGTFNLIQTQPTPLGGTPLSAVDGQFATVCGVLVNVGGQLALDVRLVNPGAPSPTPTPFPFDTRTLILLLLMLLLLSGRGINLSSITSLLTQPGGVTSLLSQPFVQSLLSQPTVQSLLSQPNLVQSLTSQLQASGVNVASLLSSIR